jgi:hypothetical protein
VAVKTGAELGAGDVFKYKGRYWTATGPGEPFKDLHGKTWDNALNLPIRLADGTDDTLLVWTDDTYQLKGSKGTALTFRNWNLRPAADVTFEVTYRKRDLTGWHVHLAGNGRLLGWVVPPNEYGTSKEGWSAFATDEPFRGTGPDDLGHYNDVVPGDLFNESTTQRFHHNPVGSGSTRDDAATELLRWLVDHGAPAVTDGPHWRVKPYDDPWCAGSSGKWATGGDDQPGCPVCLKNWKALYTDRPRKRGDGWGGKVTLHLKNEK